MWTIAEYQAVSLFSFRLGEATATGGKTLLLPTPFAIRTALVDAAIRLEGVSAAKRAFERLKSVRLAIRTAKAAAVTNLFAKVRKPRRKDEDADERAEAMQATIAFREYAHLQGPLGVALGEERPDVLSWLEGLLLHVTYFGKRGSFFQILSLPVRRTELPGGFLVVSPEAPVWSHVTGYAPGSVPVGILQVLDDWGPELTWNRLNSYSHESIVLDRDRLRRTAFVPYRIVQSSRSFTYYERISGAAQASELTGTPGNKTQEAG